MSLGGQGSTRGFYEHIAGHLVPPKAVTGGSGKWVSGMLGPILQPHEALFHQVPYEGGFAHSAPAYQRNLGQSQNPPAPASGTLGSRTAPPGTADLWVHWPQALGQFGRALPPSCGEYASQPS